MSDRLNPLFNPNVIGQPQPNALAPQPTWADAAAWHAQNLQDTWAAVQQPQTWVDAARQYGNALMMGTTAPGIRAFHGSPYDFERFDASKIGTGEGAQAFGHGLYFADNEGVARGYRDALSTPKTPEDFAAAYLSAANGNRAAAIEQMTDHAVNGGVGYTGEQAAALRGGLDLLKGGGKIEGKEPGHMYEVNVNADPQHFLDWDKPLSEQHPVVQEALIKAGYGDYLKTSLPGSQLAPHVAEGAQKLHAAGIPGIRYLDQGSRAGGQGTSNYVVFDPATIEILRKYGIAGLMAGGGAAAATQGQ